MSDIYVVFNELSAMTDFRPAQTTKYDANQWVADFAKLLYLSEQQRVAGLRTYHHPYQIVLAEGYTLQDWFQDGEFQLELRLSLQETFSRLSRLDEFPENQQGELTLDYQFDRYPAYGLGAAHQLESLAISLATHPAWQENRLLVNFSEIISQDGLEELQESTIEVLHLSQPNHLQSHQAWIEERLKTSVRTGRDLLQKAATLYPHLIFCEGAQKQIKELKAKDPLFRKIVRRLFDLENYCKQWASGAFVGSQIPNSSGESNPTMQQYGYLRQFKCPDGEIRTFEYHLKEYSYAWRIHIWPDEQGLFGLAADNHRKILVGYIGPHLPTNLYS